MNQMKAELKGQTPYKEKINTHAPSGWCIHETFSYGDVLHPVKIEYEAAVICHVCFIEFNESENRKIRDQLHYTGVY